jgi:intergrase/recombinase
MGLAWLGYTDNGDNEVEKRVVGRVGFEPTTPAMSRRTVRENNNTKGVSQVSKSPPAPNNTGGHVFESRPANQYQNNNHGGARRFESDSANNVDWQQFNQSLLQRMNDKTAEDRLRYAQQFCSLLLQNQDASALLQMAPDKRLHVMKALSCLAKFTGHYDIWLQIRHRYNLNWSTGTEKLDVFTRFFDDDNSLDKMIAWLKKAIRVLPKPYSYCFVFCTLTGLRASEAVESIRLLNVGQSNYYNPERQCLEHFRYPQIFLRRTKAAYISIVDEQILEIAKSIGKTPSYHALKMVCERRKLNMQMKYCRKIYASYLRQNGIESEIVDLLQGRVPRTVFARHYFRPSADYKQRVLIALKALKQKIV